MSARGHADSGLPLRATVRATVRRSEPDYDPNVEKLSDRIDVFLDGELLDECASWDVRKGIVTRHLKKDGRLVLEKGGVPAFETLRGTVEVRWRKDAA